MFGLMRSHNLMFSFAGAKRIELRRNSSAEAAGKEL